MKAYKAKYYHGQFIDIETGTRLIPRQNEIFTITADDDAFQEVDQKMFIRQPISRKEKALFMESKYGNENAIRILEAGSQLFFRVGNSRKVEGDESRQYIFTCSLLEDLYIFKIRNKQGDEAKHWRLEKCVCELSSCLMGGLAILENIRAISLSNLFDRTVQFYFTNQRSSSINAITDFFIYNENMEINCLKASKKLFKSINDIRSEIIDNINKTKLND